VTDQGPLVERAEIDALIEGKTIIDYFDRNADERPDQPAIHWKDGGWSTLTWSEYRTAVHEVAAGLQDLGVGSGEFVAIMAGNRPEHVIADFGVVHSGGTPVTIYSTLAAGQILYSAENWKRQGELGEVG
jgi:long-chain acyl-CoA synthetase